MSAASGKRLRRVQQLQLDVGQLDDRRVCDRRPRPMAGALGAALRNLIPPSERGADLIELSSPERRYLYDRAGLSPLHRAELEDGVRKALARRYRRAA